MARKQRRYCPVCNDLLDANLYCKNCYETVDEKEFKELERFTTTYNLFFLALAVVTAVVIYYAGASLFSDMLERTRTQEYFGIRLTIFLYAMYPIVVFTIYSIIKTLRQALSK
ncbi:MAG: hypothetical protein GXO65_03225 [Euryarchaeota archaeon]|nr:hypothetical protein [Euryarchaeota archaeon]